MIRQARQAFRLVGPDYRGRWMLLLVVALLASALEVAGAAMVYVLLAMVADPAGELALPLVGDLRAWTAGRDQRTVLLAMSAVMGAFFLVRGAVQVGATYLQHRVGEHAGARLSQRLVRSYLVAPYAFHLRRDSAELIRNGHSAVDELVGFVLLPVVRIVAAAITILAMVTLLLGVAPLATLLAVAVIGSTALLLLRMIQPRLQQLGWTSHELNADTLRSMQQSLEGIRDIKVLGREGHFADAYGAYRQALARVRYLQAVASSLPRTVIEIALLGLILVVFVGVIARGGEAVGILSVLGLFGYAGLRLQPSLQQIVAGLNNLRFAEAPLAELTHDLHTMAEPDVEEPAEPLPFEHELTLESVTMGYEGAEGAAVRDVDLTIRPGESIGICGPTGAGKSTLVDLLTGLLHPTTGRIQVDGRDLRETVRAWQRKIGMVSQTVFLLDDTIRRNITLGMSDGEVDETALSAAVELARLQAVVDELPDGLDTVVGERGIRLSGGERQRVAIARALYRQPSVLVLDEGTAALDNATEAELLAGLERARGEHTLILVAHRLSTVRACDRVVYLEDGHVRDVGTFDELMSGSAGFRRMAAARDE